MLIAYSISMSTYRIPPSLSWLIRNRRVIAGRIKIATKERAILEHRIEKAKKLIQQYDLLSQQISVLESDLAAIDRSMSLHEITIDLSQIKELRPHQKGSLFKRGMVTQSILKALSINPKTWFSTTEVAELVNSIVNTIADEEFTILRHVVRNRLYGLSFQGKIDRVNTKQVNKESFWRQKPSHRAGITYSEVPLEDDCLANNTEKT